MISPRKENMSEKVITIKKFDGNRITPWLEDYKRKIARDVYFDLWECLIDKTDAEMIASLLPFLIRSPSLT